MVFGRFRRSAVTEIQESVQSQRSSTTQSDKGSACVSAIPFASPGIRSRSPIRYEYKSYRIKKDTWEQPWLTDKRQYRWRVNNYIIWGFMVMGIAIAGYVCFDTYAKVPKHDYCLILDEDFKTLDTNVWSHEVQVDGFGTGSFDWTTTDDKNAFVDADGLHIVPTLTNETTQINNTGLLNGYTLNLTADGTCTATPTSNISCTVVSNQTLGWTIPPVRSARLTTRGKKTIKYGKIEVVAKMPIGDWLWPAIWMMPQDSKYGIWPRSGEIDLAESRGNNYTYPLGGRDTFASTLHWGPASAEDAYWRTTNGRQLRRSDFAEEYHTFGLEWSQDYMYTYMDTRLQQIFYMKYKGEQNLWQRGQFANMQTVNHTLLDNPWARTTNTNAPFDQEFYLILNVAVGSKSGWFLDSIANKPWVDASKQLAAGSFWAAVDQWLPTWGTGTTRGMTVKSVKMWQEGACGSKPS